MYQKFIGCYNHTLFLDSEMVKVGNLHSLDFTLTKRRMRQSSSSTIRTWILVELLVRYSLWCFSILSVWWKWLTSLRLVCLLEFFESLLGFFVNFPNAALPCGFTNAQVQCSILETENLRILHAKSGISQG